MVGLIVAIITESNRDDGGDFYKITAETSKKAFAKLNKLLREKYNNNYIEYAVSEEQHIQEL